MLRQIFLFGFLPRTRLPVGCLSFKLSNILSLVDQPWYKIFIPPVIMPFCHWPFLRRDICEKIRYNLHLQLWRRMAAGQDCGLDVCVSKGQIFCLYILHLHCNELQIATLAKAGQDWGRTSGAAPSSWIISWAFLHRCILKMICYILHLQLWGRGGGWTRLRAGHLCF